MIKRIKREIGSGAEAGHGKQTCAARSRALGPGAGADAAHSVHIGPSFCSRLLLPRGPGIAKGIAVRHVARVPTGCYTKGGTKPDFPTERLLMRAGALRGAEGRGGEWRGSAGR